MSKREKRNIILIVIAALIFLLVTNYEIVASFAGYIWGMFLPVTIGLIVAFVLDVPVSGFEKLLGKITVKNKKKPKEKTIHGLSIALTFICLLLIVALLCTLVIPELIRTVKAISADIKESWPAWMAKLNEFMVILEEQDIDTTFIKNYIATFDFEGAAKNLLSGAGTVIGSIASATSSTVSTIASVAIGIIIAIYALGDRNLLLKQCRKAIYSYAKTPVADKICYVCKLTKESYSKFLSGQCLEAFVLAVLIFIVFTILRLPYAGIIAILSAFCSLIPYIGAFISCAVGVFLTLLESPQKALICLIAYLAIQFIETQFIYPHIVGSSVGLSPLWTLISVLIGGKLFGLVGMIFFIPLVSVVYTVIKEDTDKRIAEKKANENLKLT